MNYVFLTCGREIRINESIVIAIACMLKHATSLGSNFKIRAIKFLRTVQPLGLKEAKDIVDLIEARGYFDQSHLGGTPMFVMTKSEVVAFLGTETIAQPAC